MTTGDRRGLGSTDPETFEALTPFAARGNGGSTAVGDPRSYAEDQAWETETYAGEERTDEAYAAGPYASEPEAYGQDERDGPRPSAFEDWGEAPDSAAGETYEEESGADEQAFTGYEDEDAAEADIEIAEVEEDEAAFESGGTTVVFPSGQSLAVTTGPVGKGEEHYDPNRSGNPLLDTSAPQRGKPVSKNFKVGELVRSSGRTFDKARLDPKLVQCLQAIRDRLGRPVVVNSGYRSYGYNIEVYRRRKQKPTESQHSSGRAADIAVSGMSGLDLAKTAIDVAGCDIGVGIGATYLHVDVRGRWARWTYLRNDDESRRAIKEIDAYRQRACARGTPTPRPATAAMPATTPAPVAAASSPPGLRRRIIDVARREWERWDRGCLRETNPVMAPVLRRYWLNLPGMTETKADARVRSQVPWSAAFISWVMSQAGTGTTFKMSYAHYQYMSAAKRNRMTSASPFIAYRINEVAPQPGDIVCKARKPSPRQACSAATYDNIDDGTEWATHGDIVVAVAGNTLTVIGGNVCDSVKDKQIRVDARGFLPERARDGCRYIAVIRLRENGPVRLVGT